MVGRAVGMAVGMAVGTAVGQKDGKEVEGLALINAGDREGARLGVTVGEVGDRLG